MFALLRFFSSLLSYLQSLFIFQLFGSQVPDMTALLNNPAMMNMARQLMSDPNIQNMMSQMMTGILGSGTNSGVSNLIEAGQQVFH